MSPSSSSPAPDNPSPPSGNMSPTPTLRPANDPSSSIMQTLNPQEKGKGGEPQTQQDLGMGRPGRGRDALRPEPIHTSTTPLPRAPSVASSRITDEEFFDAASGSTSRPHSPRTSLLLISQRPNMSSSSAGEQTPRGPTRTQTATAFSSPYQSQFSSGGGSVARPARAPRHNTSGMFPATHGGLTTGGLMPSGSMSRSASRARPPLQNINSSGAVPTMPLPGVKGKGTGEVDDDEVEVEDRGQALIKRRQRERKQARRAKEKEKERRMAENNNATGEDVSAPPSGMPGEGFLAQQQRAGVRGVSATRQRQASEGYFSSGGYASSIGSQTPRDGGASPRDEFHLGLGPGTAGRAESVYSSTTAEDEEDARRDDGQSFMEDVVREVVDTAGADVDDGVGDDDEDAQDDEEENGEGDDEGVTLKDRQDAINIEHPFGLPIWKPALYRKSRSVTRNAESALHSIPSAAAERHLLPGNILWVIVFGWWLALTCFVVAVAVSAAEVLGGGRGGYGKTLRGLAWYIGWPFGKYVEGEGAPEEDDEEDDEDDARDEEDGRGRYGAMGADESPLLGRDGMSRPRNASGSNSSAVTIRDGRRGSLAENGEDEANDRSRQTTSRDRREATVSFVSPELPAKGKSRSPSKSPLRHDERAPLLKRGFSTTSTTAGSTTGMFRRPRNRRAKFLGRLVYWPVFLLVVAPLMLAVCVLCWGMVITIPMAKLTWALLELLYFRPLEINFRSAPTVPVLTPQGSPATSNEGDDANGNVSNDTTLAGSTGSGVAGYTLKPAHLTAGQLAPTSGPKSTVLLCTYRAIGLQYYKYTIGGVNIIFINLLPLVFFTILDGLVLLPRAEALEHAHKAIPPLLALLTSQALIFVLALASVIPLSYFIGMAVASISAQSSIGMGAVINATFGSVIEIILYSIALTQGKGRLVEGSLVGSILAGVLLMPGASMCSGAVRRKEQKFNAKSAGVTSTMLIMAIIGTLTPTMFYQTYGTFELHCTGCPRPGDSLAMATLSPKDAWQCNHCYYEHPDPSVDPFYQEQVKTLMYACAGILLLSYLIGLWFSLRTHASQIWQNPQQLLKPDGTPIDPATAAAMHPAHRATLTQRMTPQAVMQHILPVHTRGESTLGRSGTDSASRGSPVGNTLRLPKTAPPIPEEPEDERSGARVRSGDYNLPAGYTPFLESVPPPAPMSAERGKNLTPMKLPGTLTTEDFTRAVAVATVSALRHQGSIISSVGRQHKAAAALGGAAIGKELVSGGGQGQGAAAGGGGDDDEGGGHEAPSWTRGVSAGVLLGCTLLYAIIAEILVDVVDVVLQGSGIDEKFLGLTLFALVPNTTEFMNAMSFAMNGNIALSMEIGSAYALQVCLLQIPAMVAFSAFYDPGKMGQVVDTFTLIFPRWDVIAIILSIFLLTYTYIEARSNYHRGSILVLAYIVLIMGFYYAPPRAQSDPDGSREDQDIMVFGRGAVEMVQAGLGAGLTKLWA